MSLFTADQLIAHAVGDYILQSDWMANEKTKRSLAAAAHAVVYSLPFCVFGLDLVGSLPQLAVIIGTHFVIDRWRLARYVVWLKNEALAPPGSGFVPWAQCTATGYPDARPPWLST